MHGWQCQEHAHRNRVEGILQPGLCEAMCEAAGRSQRRLHSLFCGPGRRICEKPHPAALLLRAKPCSSRARPTRVRLRNTLMASSTQRHLHSAPSRMLCGDKKNRVIGSSGDRVIGRATPITKSCSLRLAARSQELASGFPMTRSPDDTLGQVNRHLAYCGGLSNARVRDPRWHHNRLATTLTFFSPGITPEKIEVLCSAVQFVRKCHADAN